jgi:hypothetical protein
MANQDYHNIVKLTIITLRILTRLFYSNLAM